MNPLELHILPKEEDIPPIPYRMMLYALTAVSGLVVYGVIGSIYIMGLNPINAIYFTVITITTVGYGDISPTTPLQRLFVVTLVLGGVGLLAYAFTLTITVVTMAVEEITSGAKQRRMIAATNDHFVLCGYGRVGNAVHKELKKRNRDVIIIEKNRKIVEKELWNDPEVLAILEMPLMKPLC